MEIAVAICTCQRPEPLSAALESVLAQSTAPAEVLVIDDGELSDPFIAEWTRTFAQRGITFIYRRKPPHQRGLTRSRNVAAGIATAEVIFYLDDDGRLTPTCLQYVHDAFAADTGEALAGLDLPIIEQARAHTGRRVVERMYRLVGLWSLLGRYHRPRRIPANLATIDWLEPVAYLQGGAMAFRRQTLRDIGGFDENLRGHALGEDKDISIRAGRLGLLMRARPASVHHASHPAGRHGARHSGYETIANYLYINRTLYRIGVGEGLLLGYTVAGLIAIELAFGVVGDRRFHWGQLGGMLNALSDFARRRQQGKPCLTESASCSSQTP